MKRRAVRPNKLHLKVPYTKIDEGRIETSGSILKRLNKRIVHKQWIIEYFKCKNSKSFKRGITNPCTFSAKLLYRINSQPKFLEIIKDHSPLCNNQDRSTVEEKYCYVDTLIESESIPIANLSVQIHSEDIDNTIGLIKVKN